MFERKLSATRSGIKLAETYRNANDSHNFLCSEGHIFREQPGRLLVYIRNGNKGCTVCKKEERRKGFETAYKAKIKVLGFRCSGFVDNKTSITHVCKNEHKFKVEPGRLHTGITCPHCLTEHQEKRLATFEKAYKENGWTIERYVRKPKTSTVRVILECDSCGENKKLNMGSELRKCVCQKEKPKEVNKKRNTNMRKHAPLSERQEIFNREVATRFPHITIMGKYRGSTLPVRLKCSCGNKWETKPTNLLSSVVGCPECGIRRRTKGQVKTNADYVMQCAVASRGMLLPIETYVNDSTKLLHRCACGKTEQMVKPNTVLTKAYRKCVHCEGKSGSGAYSLKACAWLKVVEEMYGVHIQHAQNTGEKTIRLNGSIVRVDGFCKETDTVYEFLGDVWHGSPFEVHKDRVSHHPFKTKSDAKLLYETMKRFHDLTTLGYNVVWVWESAFDKKQLVSGSLNATKW